LRSVFKSLLYLADSIAFSDKVAGRHKGNKREFLNAILRNYETPAKIETTPADIERLVPLLRVLNARDKRIIETRFGLAGGEGQSLEDVAKGFNVSTERIRQLEKRSLRKISEFLPEDFLKDRGIEVPGLGYMVNDMSELGAKVSKLVKDRKLAEEQKIKIFAKMLPVRVRAQNAFICEYGNLAWGTLGEIIQYVDEGSLLRIKNIGRKSAKEMMKIISGLRKSIDPADQA
jgi:hypothetical protein